MTHGNTKTVSLAALMRDLATARVVRGLIDGVKLDQPDDRLAQEVWDRWVALLAPGGAQAPQITPDFIESLRVWTLDVDFGRAELAGLEKGFRTFARGDAARAGRLFSEEITSLTVVRGALDEAVTGRLRQRASAKHVRTDDLQKLIIEIVRPNPRISPRDVIEKLRKYQGNGVIELINDTEEEIEWTDNRAVKKRAKNTPFSGLKHRMSRARKKLSSL